jgi:hypothetical protein
MLMSNYALKGSKFPRVKSLLVTATVHSREEMGFFN